MTLSEKTEKPEELDLEKDLPLSREDMAQMQKSRVQTIDLADYLDFLEEIKAFETGGGKTEFYDTVFEL
jgi:hypothetical protein